MVRTRNYMPKQQKRLIGIAGAVAIVAVGAGVVWAANQPAAPAPAPTPSAIAAPSIAPNVASPTPTPEPDPSSAAPTQPAAPVDTSKPENVAKAWAKAYFTRPTGDDVTFQDAIKPYIDPSISEYMRTDEYNVDGKGYLDQSEGTRVLDVKITPQDGSVGIDTPTRWTRTVTVTVQGLTTGKKVEVPYILTLFRADKPWFIVSAPKAIRMGD